MLHVVFNHSAAGSMKKAMEQLGRDDRFVCIADDLSVGPIDPASAATRAEWFERELKCPVPVIDDDTEARWDEATAPAETPVAWFSRSRASDHTALLELVWRRGDAPIELVDITDVGFLRPDGTPDREVASSFGFVHPEQMIRHRLLDRREPLSSEKRADYRATWQALKNENAAFRVVRANKLVSEPITYFDDLLVRNTPTDWVVSAKWSDRRCSTRWNTDRSAMSSCCFACSRSSTPAPSRAPAG